MDCLCRPSKNPTPFVESVGVESISVGVIAMDQLN